jgi:Fur family transcriptional regulator, ferric uptake regulator
MKLIAERFEKFLRTKGLRYTRQRAAILKAIYGTHRHVSADQLYALLHKGGQAAELDISRATVYRTLALLAEGGFVQALDLGRDTGALYEHTLGHEHHDHMICLECGRIIEFSDARLEQIQAEAVARHGFRAQSHRLNVFGSCDRCARKDAAAPSGAAGPEDATAG